MATTRRSSLPHLTARHQGGIDRLQSATGRRTFKTLRHNKGEAVWPPRVEAALIEALDVYRPATTGDPRQLTRFPLRNRFIADEIFKATGKRRTPKQVGSRIQQLRDTCNDPDIQHLLSRKEYPREGCRTSPRLFVSREDDTPFFDCPSRASSPVSSRIVSSSSSFSSDSTSSDSTFSDVSSRRSSSCSSSPQYSLDTTPTKFAPSLEAMNITLPTCTFPEIEKPTQNTGLNLSVASVSDSPEFTRITISTARPLSEVDNAVRFTSETPLTPDSHYCLFTVQQGDVVVHVEDTNLTLVSTSTSGHSNYTYSVNLVPLYWSKLGCRDPFTLDQYTIVQEIMHASTPIVGPVSARPPGDTIALKVIYDFKYYGIKTEPATTYLPFHYEDTHIPSPQFSAAVPSCQQSFEGDFGSWADSQSMDQMYYASAQQQQLDFHGRYDYITDSTHGLHSEFYDSNGYPMAVSSTADWPEVHDAFVEYSPSSQDSGFDLDPLSSPSSASSQLGYPLDHNLPM